MIKEPYVPTAWPYLPIPAMAAAQARAIDPSLDRRKKWHKTKPLAPFQFELREKTRPMSIMQVWRDFTVSPLPATIPRP